MKSELMFVLFKIVEHDGLTKDVLHANLTAPDGWMLLAQLCSDDLVFVLGDEVVPTEAGNRIVHELRRMGVRPTTTAPAADTDAEVKP